MAILAAACGILIVAFALLTTRRAPTDAQFGIEVTSFVGGLVLCFLAVVLARLAGVNRRLDALARRYDAERETTLVRPSEELRGKPAEEA